MNANIQKKWSLLYVKLPKQQLDLGFNLDFFKQNIFKDLRILINTYTEKETEKKSYHKNNLFKVNIKK